MKQPVALIFLFVLFSAPSFAQNVATGFYLEIPGAKRSCVNKIPTINGKQSFCVADNPVITATEFESVSEVRYEAAAKTKYIELVLTPKATKVISGLMATLPESKMLLIVDNKVVGIFNPKAIEQITGRIIRIDSAMDAPEIDWIYDKLKTVRN